MRQLHISIRRQLLLNAMRMVFASAACAVTVLPSSVLAQSDSWPSKPIRMVVPFPAGSFTDAIARVMSEGLSRSLGQPVVVENKAGANGLIGVSEVARAAPDGYTLLVTNSSSITINPQLYKKAPYKAADLTPVTTMVEAPFILVANSEWAQKNKIGSMKDLLEYARSNPDRLSYGSAGPGNIAHLSYVMLSNRTKIKTTHIPYKAAAQAQLAVLSGEIDSAFDTWAALSHIQSGKLKPLAVSSTRRMAQLPDVPTIEQTGVPDFTAIFWIGLLAPAGTPPQIVQKIFNLSQGVLDDPKARSTLASQGEVAMLDPAAFSRRIQREVASWGEVIQREGIKLD